MIKVIVFDFDGVLVDSNHLKYEAIFTALENRERIDRKLIADVYLEIGGFNKTRFEIFDSIFMRAGYPKNEIKRFTAECADRYDRLVRQGIRERGLKPGTRGVLSVLSEKFRLYINSATSEPALQRTVHNIKLDEFFKGVYGKPPSGVSSEKSKKMNLGKIIAHEGIGGNEVWFVGDGESDLAAARERSCAFVGMANEFNHWSKTADFPVIKNLRDLPGLLSKKK